MNQQNATARRARRDAIAMSIYPTMLARVMELAGPGQSQADHEAAVLAIDRANVLLLEMEQNGVPDIGEDASGLEDDCPLSLAA